MHTQIRVNHAVFRAAEIYDDVADSVEGSCLVQPIAMEQLWVLADLPILHMHIGLLLTRAICHICIFHYLDEDDDGLVTLAVYGRMIDLKEFP